MKRCIGEKVLMKGHDDEKTQWFKDMTKEVLNKCLKWKKDVSLVQINIAARKDRDQAMMKNQ